MPCSDNEARSYLDDWRTQQFIKDEKKLNGEIKKLEKELNKSKTQAQKELEDQIKKLNQDNINLAKRLNKTTELLCGATFKMFTYDQENHEKYLKGLLEKNDLEKPKSILKHGTKLHQWFPSHDHYSLSSKPLYHLIILCKVLPLWLRILSNSSFILEASSSVCSRNH